MNKIVGLYKKHLNQEHALYVHKGDHSKFFSVFIAKSYVYILETGVNELSKLF